jgi:DNA-binding response OmpR family regulator
MARVLIIDDEREVALGIKECLEFEGYEVMTAESGRDGLDRLMREAYDILLLDIVLPEMDGFEVLKEIRKVNKELPIIVISARASEEDRVFCLNLGADDFVNKPFSVAEMVARIRAHIRRVNTLRGSNLTAGGFYPGYEPVTIKIGEAVVFLDKMLVRLSDKEFPLTPKEIGIIRLLYKNRGKVVPREMMMKEIWGEGVFVTERVIDTNVVSIRKKIGDAGRKAKYIKTVFGVGYKMIEY